MMLGDASHRLGSAPPGQPVERFMREIDRIRDEVHELIGEVVVERDK